MHAPSLGEVTHQDIEVRTPAGALVVRVRDSFGWESRFSWKSADVRLLREPRRRLGEQRYISTRVHARLLDSRWTRISVVSVND